MNLQNNGLCSGIWYLKSKPLGKVKRRVQEMKNPSVASVTSIIDLSHNESTRLATEALLNQGLVAYREVLIREGEVDFLSLQEKGYILENATDVRSTSLWESEGDEQTEGSSASQTALSLTQTETYCPAMSESEPPDLDHGWPVEEWSYHLQGRPGVEVYFQCDREGSMKDLVRESINKATTVLAIVMDTFSDVEIFCDILEATVKRNVSVYLLLDHLDLQLFVNMCETLQINRNHLTRMSVRSVRGGTYCAKSGRKFTGQIKEKFMIIDCNEVLAGSYSFTWLSWQVHRSMAVLFKGSAVKPFDLEFRKLYATSKPVVASIMAAAPFVPIVDMFTTSPSVEVGPSSQQTEHGSPRLQDRDNKSLATTAQPCYTSLYPNEVIKTQPKFNTQPTNPNFTGQVTTTVQPRLLNTQVTGPLVKHLIYSSPQSHRFDWITQRHTVVRPVVLPRSFMTWRSLNSNELLHRGTSSGLLSRHPVLKTGQWCTIPHLPK